MDAPTGIDVCLSVPEILLDQWRDCFQGRVVTSVSDLWRESPRRMREQSGEWIEYGIIAFIEDAWNIGPTNVDFPWPSWIRIAVVVDGRYQLGPAPMCFDESNHAPALRIVRSDEAAQIGIFRQLILPIEIHSVAKFVFRCLAISYDEKIPIWHGVVFADRIGDGIHSCCYYPPIHGA
jgi:hypothetical protein